MVINIFKNMKHKELALEKIEKLSNQLKTLSYHLNRNEVEHARKVTEKINEQVESLRDQISIEQN
jgi:hypothetical protein